MRQNRRSFKNENINFFELGTKNIQFYIKHLFAKKNVFILSINPNTYNKT